MLPILYVAFAWGVSSGAPSGGEL